MDWHYLFESDLGWIAFSFRERAILKSGMGYLVLEEALKRCEPDSEAEVQIDKLPRSTDCRYQFAKECRRRLEQYLSSGGNLMQEIPFVDPSHTPFQSAVIRACRAIPAGKTATYGQLALAAGSPGASRAVGNQMARNPLPLLIPCHRVVAAGNQLGGFSAPQGLDLKRRLLEIESTASVLTFDRKTSVGGKGREG